jgi:2,3-bisphosphoglycerate-dependent phosphoglycerate mutase
MLRAPLNLILLRHGESDWNAKNLFTGWVDVELSEVGEAEAKRAGQLIRKENLAPKVLHTSVLRRAINTANLALAETETQWLPTRRSWRLNERHYGTLQGKNKKMTLEEFGEEQFMIWRRSYDVPPPPIDPNSEFAQNHDARYELLPPDAIPLTECLKDVSVRLLPYWQDSIVKDLKVFGTVLVVAHGNSLRALVKHLDGVSDTEVVGLNIPTGIPLHYELGDDMRPVKKGGAYLDPEAAADAVAKVAQQGR